MTEQWTAPLLEAHTGCDEPELIRGVPLSTVISNWRLLSKQEDDSLQSLSSGYSAYTCSRPVDQFCYFISHSSDDEAWKKWFMLLIAHNLKAALLGATLLASMVSLACWQWPYLLLCNNVFLPGVGHVKLGWGHVIFNPLVAFFTRFMHRLRCSDSYTFLDRACISQTDPDLKAAGIRSIGAFLKRTHTLLVFWGHDYFERLWCIYEIDVFSMIHGMDRVQILPIDMAFLWVAVFSSGTAASLTMVLDMKLNPCMQTVSMSWMNKIPLACCLALLGVSKAQHFGARRKMMAVLSSFQVRKARCSCCSLNHRSKDGRKLHCDRIFIEAGIRELHEDKKDAINGLDEFDNFIRQDFLQFANQTLGAETASPSILLVLLCLSWTSFDVDMMIVNFTLDSSIWAYQLLALPVMWCIIFLADLMSGYLIVASYSCCPSYIRAAGAVWFNLSVVIIGLFLNLFQTSASESLLTSVFLSGSLVVLTGWLRYSAAVM